MDKKEINSITIDGNENIILNGISGSTVNINSNNSEELVKLFEIFNNKLDQMPFLFVELIKKKMIRNSKKQKYVSIEKKIVTVHQNRYKQLIATNKIKILLANLMTSLNQFLKYHKNQKVKTFLDTLSLISDNISNNGKHEQKQIRILSNIINELPYDYYSFVDEKLIINQNFFINKQSRSKINGYNEEYYTLILENDKVLNELSSVIKQKIFWCLTG